MTVTERILRVTSTTNSNRTLDQRIADLDIYCDYRHPLSLVHQ